MTSKPHHPEGALYEAAWAAALRLRSFSYQKLAAEMAMPVPRATSYVRHWLEHGAVELSHVGEKRRKVWRVVAEASLPPLPDAASPRTRRGTAAGNMWRVMRKFRSFSPTDLAVHATTEDVKVAVAEAQGYCRMLVQAGYLRVERKANPGKREAIYRLIRDTGPEAPRQRRVRGIWDGNLERFTYLDGEAA